MNLLALIEEFKSRRVVVLGDLVADVFVYGEIARVSREAPVLILSHRDTQLAPGGAANAVHNLWALGARPVPVGLVGDDDEGRGLVEYFDSLGIDTSGIQTIKSYATPTKTRVLAGAAHASRQQVLRIDRGDPLDPAAGRKARKALQQPLASRLRKADAVMISDYGYGAADPDLAAQLRGAGIPVTLDSRFRIADYSGLTAATPNEPELETALGIRIDDDPARLEKAGRALLRRVKHDALLVTRGRNGMALFEPGRKTTHIPIHGTDEVADVTGAGDTVISVFTLALAAGSPMADAARLANYAGGIAVMKHGTQPISSDELGAAVGTGGPA
jgi:rfaE bifunctional protein kinase chain/domain